MKIQADSVVRDAAISTDVCIVGGGAAGISLALKFAGSACKVTLLESGQMEASSETQDLYRGAVVDAALHSPLDRFRQRRLGGSTTIWGGRCMPLDPIDFEARSYIPQSGWPFGYAELRPHYVDANRLVEAGKFAYQACDAANGTIPPLIEGFTAADVSTEGLERFSCPTDFAQRYLDRLLAAPNIDIYLGANCTGIQLTADGTRVQSVQVATLGGNRFRVSAGTVIIAMGGLENARLLLASRDVARTGIGNAHDVVGRYYMAHIAGHVGKLKVDGPPSQVHHGYSVTPDGIYARRRLALTADAQRRLQVTNMVARLHFPQPSDPDHGSGILSAIFLGRRLVSYEYSRRLSEAGSQPSRLLAHGRNVLFKWPDTVRFLAHWARKRKMAERKFPSVILRNQTNTFSLDVHAEQIPNRDSRVTLDDDTDVLGMPKLKVDWRYDPQDIAAVGKSLDAMAAAFAQSGRASFVYQPETLGVELTKYGAYGGHHIGMTRMGSDVRTSVVDADCKVHGVDNLYVAGSSVFPTSSQANPTLTIVAMSLRLADHVAARSSLALVPLG